MKFRKPRLIDTYTTTTTEVGDGWFIAKPMPWDSVFGTIERAYHAWLVLRGRATAITFREDTP